MPESLIVIGKIAFLPKEAVSPDHLAKQIGNGATVLLIEGYGVMVVGESAMQVRFSSLHSF